MYLLEIDFLLSFVFVLALVYGCLELLDLGTKDKPKKIGKGSRIIMSVVIAIISSTYEPLTHFFSLYIPIIAIVFAIFFIIGFLLSFFKKQDQKSDSILLICFCCIFLIGILSVGQNIFIDMSFFDIYYEDFMWIIALILVAIIFIGAYYIKGNE